MATALTVPSKEVVVLLELSYGTSSLLRFNDTQEQLVLPIGTFESLPTLDIKLPPYSGIFERKEIQVEFAYGDLAFLFAQGITSGRAYSEVHSRAWQWTRSPGSDRLQQLFNGRVTSAVRNPNGRSDLIRLNMVTQKAETQRAAGIVEGADCVWTFGDLKTCTKDLTSLKKTGAITVVNRNVVTITGLPASPDRYWDKGYISADGVTIKIREWLLATPTIFKLAQLVPKEWEDTILGFGSKSIVVTPGCAKTPEVCLNTWNNLDNFQGIGFAIPAYNPNFENGG